ncbi:hypothetical protein GALL_554820 [mine drainage metagenome]|uniref:Uncharacterized protein n=1 Tax=mine drainage metagenome TaxID=410659 RepID=A0A1J5P598_9ZZZZ
MSYSAPARSAYPIGNNLPIKKAFRFYPERLFYRSKSLTFFSRLRPEQQVRPLELRQPEQHQRLVQQAQHLQAV